MFKRIISALLVTLLLLSSLCALSVSAEENDTVTPADPEELAGELMDAVSDLQHPYVFYSKDEIPALQQKVKQGISKKAFDLLSASAPGFSTRTLGVKAGANGVVGRQLQHYVSYVAIYSAIANRADLAKNVVKLVISCAEQGSIDVYNSINGALCIGDFGHAYALAYDMLYEYMTDDQRALVKAEMEEIGEWIFTNSAAVDTWGSQEARRKAWNWNAVTHGALGMIALALGDHEEWLALAIERMEGYYEYAVDADGAAMEGLHYIGYAFNSWAPLGNSIYRLSGVEVMDAYPQMQKMPYWSMYVTAPQGGEQAKINQGSSMGNYSSSFYIINRYKQSDALWGWLHTYNLFGDAKFSAEYQGNGWSAPQLILYEDQSFEYAAPTEENNPLTMSFEKGLVSARDSWDNDASMITFTCGYGQPGCWNHPDDNTFTFFAKGESFVVDLGEGKLNSSDHNVVLMDGKGMDFSGGGSTAVGVLEEEAILENGALYLRGNNLSSYIKNGTLSASLRHLVYSGGDTPYVLIFDYAKKNGSHTYSTNFYTSTGNKVTIAADGSYATIQGSRKQEICYVYAFTPEGVTLSTQMANATAVGISTSSTSTLHGQATLFITANPDGSAPEVEMTSEGKVTTVKITRIENGESVTDTYEFDYKALRSPEIATTEAPTEAPTETQAPTETETKKAVETSAVEPSEQETEPEQVESGKETDATSTGCKAFTSIAVIPVVLTCAIPLLAKKKKENE